MWVDNIRHTIISIGQVFTNKQISNTFTCLTLVCVSHNISQKHQNVLNTHSDILFMQKWEHIESCMWENLLWILWVIKLVKEGLLVNQSFIPGINTPRHITNYSWEVMISLIIYIPMQLQVLDIPFAWGSQSEHKTRDALSTSCE